ncbi:MAG TPA: beta galactosidase jelly roll domain-containing protein, partial [Mucilaginibacter sp.]|nr:beta galactosidase jelly roll domain-containing protein [Mucilaginibacter sp.]
MYFTRVFKKAAILLLLPAVFVCSVSFAQPRIRADFDNGWKFHLGDITGAQNPDINDSDWRTLNLPHDWSIEGTFSKDNPATPEGGALPGGIGWYRKVFTLPEADKDKKVYIDFDGVYEKSTVWINGHELGFRPNGYISFEYDMTPYVHFGGNNTIAVKVDNSVQPN